MIASRSYNGFVDDPDSFRDLKVGALCMEQIIEERQEICSTVSKIVSLMIFRQRPKGSNEVGEIVGFQCESSSAKCESRCTYKMMMEDF